MTSGSPTSSSESPSGGGSRSFELLHEKVQKWIWREGWMALRDVQEQAIVSILQGSKDLILSAATAAGKTEAAFLPICSELVDDAEGSVRALYVGPLKALINDQFRRLESLCEDLHIPVTKWHGDASAAGKRRLLEKPRGILMITPESLEALLCRRGSRVPALFGDLSVVVIDELHSFVATERGIQLQSLLQRLEASVGSRIRRIGLSATLGEMSIAADYLRPRGGAEVELLTSDSDGQELKLLLKGYIQSNPAKALHTMGKAEEEERSALKAICDDLFKRLRGHHNLIFANARSLVEQVADSLRRRCESRRLPNEFFPHHGSLSKNLREDLEQALKDGNSPLSVVCTSTLELGIDIGSVTSVAQIGTPPSVSSLRQRLGRSGRKPGEPAILRQYIEEAELTPRTSLIDRLRPTLFEAVADLELLLDGWCETPAREELHLSTAIQQVLALVVERGGIRAKDAFRLLCADGPFDRLTPDLFERLLRRMGETELIEQDRAGLLLLGSRGEGITEHYSFYAAFKTPEEYRIQTGERTLGSIPMDSVPPVDAHLIFAGRRWLVVDVDHGSKTIRVARSPAGRVPIFKSGGLGICCHVRKRMKALYQRGDTPAFLDEGARQLLAQGRECFATLGLAETGVVRDGSDVLLLPWTGSREVARISMELRAQGAVCLPESIALRLTGQTVRSLRTLLRCALEEGGAGATSVLSIGPVPRIEKYDDLLDDGLALAQWQSKIANWDRIEAVLRTLLENAVKESVGSDQASSENGCARRWPFVAPGAKSALAEAADLLGVESSATLDEIRRSYRRCIKTWHPDRFAAEPRETQRAAHEMILRIRWAFETLCSADEDRRVR